jgi:electron transport complex protein RnfD
MRFATAAPPQWRSPATVGAMMRTVLYALVPALLAHVWFYGAGILLNTAIALLTAVITEAVCLRLAGKPAAPFLADGSALVTAVLFAFCLPPLCPFWVTAAGMVFAIGVAKHAYGGLGFNVFNPAMAGYVLVLVSFPDAMTVWPAPDIGDLDYVRPDLVATLQYCLTGTLPGGLTVDAVATATTLDSAKEGLSLMRTMDELRVSPVFGDFGGAGWEWVNNFIAIGGFVLLLRGIIRWHTPAAVLCGLLGMATLAWLLDPNTHPSPGFHLFSGGAMLGAFFIATDPVSSPTTARGRLIYGAGIGVLTYLIRTFGSYADGVAFAVLLMNLAAPLIDRWTRPRVYGRTA